MLQLDKYAWNESGWAERPRQSCAKRRGAASACCVGCSECKADACARSHRPFRGLWAPEKMWCDMQLMFVLYRWQHGVDLLRGYADAGLQHDVFVRSPDSRLFSQQRRDVRLKECRRGLQPSVPLADTASGRRPRHRCPSFVKVLGCQAVLLLVEAASWNLRPTAGAQQRVDWTHCPPQSPRR